ncbi:MAG: PQQ-like beta-propeller repeat protein [Acidobacteria bacterium]|nr:PQQ-like beta-propeller repeat protein [Acidobacteriota bacterium]
MKRYLVTCAVLAGLTLATTPAGDTGHDWPQYRGAGRDGISSETGLLTTWPSSGPPELWRAPLGEGYSGISAVGERLYTMYARDGEARLVCLAAGDGGEHWSMTLGKGFKEGHGNGPRSTPTVDGDMVFALSATGRLVAVTASDGEMVWEHDLKKEFDAKVPYFGASGSPLVEDGLVILEVGGSDSRNLMAFKRDTGEVAWGTGDQKTGYSSPLAVTINGTRQVLSFTGVALVSVAPDSGKALWSVPWKTSYDIHAAMPIFMAPDRIFISSGYDTGAALLKVSGKGDAMKVDEVWRSRVMKNHFNSSVLVGGYLYGFDDGTLKCIDGATGEEKWKQRGFAKGSLLAADGHLFIFSESGELAVAEVTPEGYRETGRAKPMDGKTWTMPTLSHGRLYVRDEAELVAFDLSSGS